MLITPEQRAEFDAAFSTTFLDWQEVEVQLFLIFSTLTKGMSYRVQSAVFHSVLGLQIRLDMIHAAASVFFENSPLLDEWKKLSSRVSKQAKKRNELAHFALMTHRKRDGTHRLIVMPSVFDSKARNGKRHDTRQIRHMGQSFRKLVSDLSIFHNKFSRKPLSSFRKFLGLKRYR